MHTHAIAVIFCVHAFCFACAALPALAASDAILLLHTTQMQYPPNEVRTIAVLATMVMFKENTDSKHARRASTCMADKWRRTASRTHFEATTIWMNAISKTSIVEIGPCMHWNSGDVRLPRLYNWQTSCMCAEVNSDTRCHASWQMCHPPRTSNPNVLSFE